MIKLLSLLFTLLMVQPVWAAPKVVTVGAFLNNIQNLDLITLTFIFGLSGLTLISIPPNLLSS